MNDSRSRLRKFGSGVGWGGLSIAAVAAFQLVFLVVMARQLEPADFGVVAIANLTLRFLSYFAQLGVVPALVQKEKIGGDDVAAALAVSLAVSAASALVAVAAAPLAASFFEMPALAAVAAALSLSFVSGGFAAISTGLLRREMRFKALAAIDAASYVAGYGIVGLGMAFAGAGVWSLVGAALSQALLTAALSYACTRHPLTLRHGAAARRHFVAFGGRYSVIGFFEFLAGSIDVMAVGKAFGEVGAGFYNRATTLANLPVQQPATVMTRALFPVLSSISAEREKQAIGLQLGLLCVGSYALAAGMALSVAAAPVVALLLGAKWAPVVPIMEVYALSVGPRFMTHIAGTSMDALGALDHKLAAQGSCLVLMVVAVLLALPHGPVAVAAAVVAVELVRIATLLVLLARALPFGRGQWARTLAPLAVGGACSAIGVSAALRWLSPGVPAWVQVGAALLAATVAWLAALTLCRRWLAELEGTRWIVQRLPGLRLVFPR